METLAPTVTEELMALLAPVASPGEEPATPAPSGNNRYLGKLTSRA